MRRSLKDDKELALQVCQDYIYELKQDKTDSWRQAKIKNVENIIELISENDKKHPIAIIDDYIMRMTRYEHITGNDDYDKVFQIMNNQSNYIMSNIIMTLDELEGYYDDEFHYIEYI